MIKHITLDEAKKAYYPRPATMSVKYTDAYTLTPDKDDLYREYVTYWVKKQRFDAQLSLNEGYIYILHNSGAPGVVKIGYTDRTPQERVKEINSATGVVVPWYIVNAFPCRSPKQIETLVHNQLNEYRINKELFNINASTAEEVIVDIIKENNAGL